MILRKLKKFCINIVGFFFFWNKNIRRFVKDFLTDFSLQSFNCMLKFKKNKIRNNSVLLIEINNCHGEVISGYIKYFEKLGFNVDCLLHIDFYKENPFVRLDMSNVHCFYCNRIDLTQCLKYKFLSGYKHIVVMSSTCYCGKNWRGVLDMMPHLRKDHSLYVVEHELNCIEPQNETDLLKNNRVIVLGKFDRGVFVNPCLFGDVKITHKNKITTFITVGGIAAFRKNHAELINAIQELVKQKLKFKVIIIGKGELNNLPDEIKPYIEITGRLKFPEMFEQMEKADFFLPLLDPENPDHNRYITTGVTGSAQLIYAFEKIPVIHKKFADFYRFDNKNAIVFDKDLATAMAKAISLSSPEYNKLQSELHNTKQEIICESEKNLKGIL